jgi:transcriptional regulator with XRE-family HTH domain
MTEVKRNQKVGNAAFGKWLAARREEAGMTRYELAEALEISYPYVSQLETGYRNPSTSVIGGIRTALGVTADEIYAELYPPTMVKERATMAMLRNAFSKHPKLAGPEDKAEIVSIEVEGQRMELVLSDRTTITLEVNRVENAV